MEVRKQESASTVFKMINDTRAKLIVPLAAPSTDGSSYKREYQNVAQ